MRYAVPFHARYIPGVTALGWVILALVGFTPIPPVLGEELPVLEEEGFDEGLDATRSIAGVLLYDQLVEEGFDEGLDGWQTSDPDSAAEVWRIDEREGDPFLRVTGKSEYEPPYRSPHSIALLRDMVVGDFELTVRVQNTNPNAGPHRDLCIFWGYQDPAHFYYVHLGAKADPHACQIFVVDGAPRKMITVDKAEGTPWTDGWHEVKVKRSVADGTVEVYFDDMTRPLMTAKDDRFAGGQVGLGTFDDHGNFDNFVLRGRTEKGQ